MHTYNGAVDYVSEQDYMEALDLLMGEGRNNIWDWAPQSLALKKLDLRAWLYYAQKDGNKDQVTACQTVALYEGIVL